MSALSDAVRWGKAMYVGVSSYSAKRTREAASILEEQGTKLLIHQPSYSMLNRWIETDLLDALEDVGAGAIVFSPLAQGLLTDRYLDGIPADSRAADEQGSFHREFLREEVLEKVRSLRTIAQDRGQSLAQMALSWCLRDDRVTSVLIGASSVKQLEENVAATEKLGFSEDELTSIDRYATESGLNLWKPSSDVE